MTKSPILPNFLIYGDVKKTNISLFKDYNFKDFIFNYKITKDNYSLEKISFEFNKINFISKNIKIKKKDNLHIVKGEINNKDGILNSKIISKLTNLNQDYLDISKAKILSENKFSFKLTNEIKIKDLEIQSKVNIDKILNDDRYPKSSYALG